MLIIKKHLRCLVLLRQLERGFAHKSGERQKNSRGGAGALRSAADLSTA
jgi:hypothetical protein